MFAALLFSAKLLKKINQLNFQQLFFKLAIFLGSVNAATHLTILAANSQKDYAKPGPFITRGENLADGLQGLMQFQVKLSFQYA